MGILTTCAMCGELFSANNFSEPYCQPCQQIDDEVASQMADAEMNEQAQGEWEAQQAADAEADAWHSQYD